MTRLRRTFVSLRSLGVEAKVMVPYRRPRGQPRTIKGIVRYLVLLFQVALSKADVYHFFNVPDVIGLPLLLKRGIVVYDVRSPWFSSIRASLHSRILSMIGEFIEWMMTRGADVVLAANYPIAHRAHRWGARAVTMVPNYPPSDFRPRIGRDAMRKELAIGDESIVLYLGKISRVEGSELLKHVILKTCSEVEDVRFLVVGDGPEKPTLDSFLVQQNLNDRVIVTGWVPHENVADYIAAADICLLPRMWDSFSPFTAPENITKAAEYLAIGRPIIVPKMGGFAAAEFPVIAVEPAEMAAALIDFLRHPQEAGVFERPSWDESHRRLKRVYERLGAVP